MLLEKIEGLLKEVSALSAKNAEEVEQLRIKYLSKKGEINALMADFRTVAADQKKAIGVKINELKQVAQNKINGLKEQLEEAEASSDDIDLTRTAYPVALGTRHPLTIVKNQIIDIFSRMGFTLYHGPEVDDDKHVFTMLNFAADQYLSLEDDLARLQKRFSRMFGVEGNANLYLATQADSLNQGLQEQLTEFLQSNPATKLVIIDTLQKIREFTSSSYSYASDYHIINILKEIAARYNICIVVVHHTRKMEAEDKFDKISGTTGLLGAADGAMILQKEKRTDKRAQLNIVGRELPDQEIIMEFMPENCTWKFIRSCQQLWEEPKDLLLEQVAALVSDENKIWHGSATQMLQALNISTDDIKPHILSRRLNVKVDKLYNDYGIYYHNKRSNKGSDITLKKLDAKTA